RGGLALLGDLDHRLGRDPTDQILNEMERGEDRRLLLPFGEASEILLHLFIELLLLFRGERRGHRRHTFCLRLWPENRCPRSSCGVLLSSETYEGRGLMPRPPTRNLSRRGPPPERTPPPPGHGGGPRRGIALLPIAWGRGDLQT